MTTIARVLDWYVQDHWANGFVCGVYCLMFANWLRDGIVKLREAGKALNGH